MRYRESSIRLTAHFKAHLHQASVLQQLCSDASDSVLIENNEVA